MPSTVDGQVGNWTNMVGHAAVAARAARQAAPSVESVRCVEWGATDANWGLVRVTCDGYAFTVTQQFDGPPNSPTRHSTIVDILRGGLVPPDDATLAKLHKLRAQMLAPVSMPTEDES